MPGVAATTAPAAVVLRMEPEVIPEMMRLLVEALVMERLVEVALPKSAPPSALS